MQNNLAKIAKWTMCALLAGADMIKLGYVSRAGELLVLYLQVVTSMHVRGGCSCHAVSAVYGTAQLGFVNKASSEPGTGFRPTGFTAFCGDEAYTANMAVFCCLAQVPRTTATT